MNQTRLSRERVAAAPFLVHEHARDLPIVDRLLATHLAAHEVEVAVRAGTA
jgi:hypothetical protein